MAEGRVGELRCIVQSIAVLISRHSSSNCSKLTTDCHYDAAEGQTRIAAVYEENQSLKTERHALRRDNDALRLALPGENWILMTERDNLRRENEALRHVLYGTARRYTFSAAM